MIGIKNDIDDLVQVIHMSNDVKANVDDGVDRVNELATEH